MFKRMVVYLYYYENGEKKKNCGYAKMTMHQGDCRVELNMIEVPELEGEIRLCFGKESESEIVVAEAMRGTVQDGDMCLRYQCKCGEVAGQMSIEELKWILVDNGSDQKKVVCGAVKQEELDFDMLLVSQGQVVVPASEEEKSELTKVSASEEGKSELTKVSASEEGKAESTAVSMSEEEKTEPTEVYGQDEERAKQIVVREHNGEKPEQVEVRESNEELQELVAQNMSVTDQATPILEEDETSVYEYDQECLKNKQECQKTEKPETLKMVTWQEKLFHTFPKVVLHINGEETTGIRLRPQDMVWFPSEYWRVATNKFLLNSYYNYQYILFFRGTGKKKGKYYLGMPGCMRENHAMTAAQFGFPEFFEAGGEPRGELAYQERKEKFGFWCRET